MINRACIFSDRPNTSQIEEQKFLRLDLCTLKLTQKIQALVYFLYNFTYKRYVDDINVVVDAPGAGLRFIESGR